MVTQLATDGGAVLSDKRNQVADVYFVQVGYRGLLKIGFSTNLGQRMRHLASGYPTLRLLGSIPGTRLDEAQWHRDWSHLRAGGEWFRGTPELQQAIMSAVLERGWTGTELGWKSRNSPERRRQRTAKL